MTGVGNPPRHWEPVALRLLCTAEDCEPHWMGPFTGELRYDGVMEPTGVTLVVATRQKSVPWLFARSLLLDGLYATAGCPAGVGDVRVWSVPDETVHIELTAPGGRAHLTAPWQVVEAFIRQVYALVPDELASEWLGAFVDCGLAGMRETT